MSRSSISQYEPENSGVYTKVTVERGLHEEGVLDNIDLYLIP
jgi:hypothetical protein